MINEFRNEYYFLSNFYPCKVRLNGVTYSNAEAAFQAQKSLDHSVRKQFANLSGAEAKRLGKTIELRPDWEQKKKHIMYSVVHAKFMQNNDLADKLILTGNERLVEGNWFNDEYWGYSFKTGRGNNKLGKILMKTRLLMKRRKENVEG